MIPLDSATRLRLQDEAAATRDPYAKCEKGCHHDLARAVLVSDLIGPSDGPLHPDTDNVPANYWAPLF